jgi:hypothetical protein
MRSATYEHSTCTDPTDSYLFKIALLLDWLTAKVKHRILIEVTRLLILGFYEDFRDFLHALEQAEDQCRSEAEFKAVWMRKLAAAERVAKLVGQLESIGHVPYNGRDLVNYLVGNDRLEELQLFVKATRLEREAEAMLDKAKRGFLASFAKRRLARDQRAALLQKYRELTQLTSGTTDSTSRS